VGKTATNKTATKMDKKTVESYRKKLLDKRRELMAAYTKNRQHGRESDEGGSKDLADKASSSYAKEFLYSLSNTERSILSEIEASLARMEEGEYGVCDECGQKINRKRLDAVPWARYCVPCKERIEQGVGEEVAD